MASKLSSRQQAQLAYLELLPKKLQRIYSVVEQMALPRVDETLAADSAGCWTTSRETPRP